MLHTAAPLATIALVLTATQAAAQPAPSGPFGRLPVSTMTLACTDVPAALSDVPAARVLAVQDGSANKREAAAGVDVLTLSGGTSAGLNVGDTYAVRRRGEATHDAARLPTRVPVARTVAWVTVTAADERYALAHIERACDAVLPGDAVEPAVEVALPATLGPSGPPMWPDMAKVLFGRDGRRTFANGDVFSIDRGTARGVVPGTRMVFYRDTRRNGPLVEVGQGVALTSTADSSTVVLTTVLDAVRSGDWVAIRGERAGRP